MPEIWMKNLPDSLPVSEINLPGTHDTCANHVKLKFFTKCQNHSVAAQLKMGIRFLDIRVEVEGDRLKTVHGAVTCKADRALRETLYFSDVKRMVEEFLRANPSETVIVCFKCDHGGPSEEAFRILSEHEELIGNALWFTENRIPKLGEVRGRAVFLNRCEINTEEVNAPDRTAGLNLSGWPVQNKTDIFDTAYMEIPSWNGADSPAAGNWLLQDHYRLTPQNKWDYAIYPTLLGAPQKDGIVLNYFSANNGKHSPRQYARYIYRRFASYELENGKKYGWLILDYPTEEIVKRIVLTNF